MSLRAIVVGAGWAAEGYVTALRAAGVEVIALCGRTRGPALRLAERLDVPDVPVDWRPALSELRPDIVAVTTPAAPHREIVEMAASLRCHVVCEKPLALSGSDAEAMLTAVERAGVRHAYGSTSRYDAYLEAAKHLVDDGQIGDIVEIESVSHFGVTNAFPHFWIHRLSSGGGMLFNVLPHFLGQALLLTGGGPVTSVIGQAVTPVDRAPVGPAIHDFRDWSPLTEVELADAEWAEVDADLTATVVAAGALATGGSARLLFHASTMTLGHEPSYFDVHGTTGTLHLSDFPWHANLRLGRPGGDWRDVPVMIDATDPVQRGWDRLVAAFVADVRGQEEAEYPTFAEGLLANRVIDDVRGSLEIA